MRKNYLVRFILMCTLGILSSCSSQTEFFEDELENSMSGIESGNSEVKSGVTFVLKTPAADELSFIQKRSRATGIGGTAAMKQTQEEWKISNLSLYIFEYSYTDENVTNLQKRNYYYLRKIRNNITFKDKGQAQVPGESGINNGDGTYTYTEPIIEAMNGKYYKFVLVANAPEIAKRSDVKEAGFATDDNLKSSLTWYNFYSHVAPFYPKDNDNADVFYRKNYIDEGAKEQVVPYEGGMIMSAVASNSAASAVYSGGDTESYFKIDYGAHIELKADLVRNMARIDIVHNTPNMVITDMTLSKAHNLGYIFQSDQNYPRDCRTSYVSSAGTTCSYKQISFKPLKEYADKLGEGQEGIKFTPKADALEKIGFTSLLEEPDSPAYSPDLNPANILKHAFYCHEVYSSSYFPSLNLKYKLYRRNSDGTLNEKFDEGTMDIILAPRTQDGKPDYTKYIWNNHLYTIVLGDGEDATFKVKTSFVVNKWKVVDIPVHID